MPHVLLIDDDDLLRKVLRTALEQMGHTVVEARNGAEGLELHAREAVDLVITDLIMPDKEGLETILELRRKQPGVKIIAMSGGGRIMAGNYLQMAGQMGAQRVLAKPFGASDLAAAINSVLSPPPGKAKT